MLQWKAQQSGLGNLFLKCCRSVRGGMGHLLSQEGRSPVTHTPRPCPSVRNQKQEQDLHCYEHPERDRAHEEPMPIRMRRAGLTTPNTAGKQELSLWEAARESGWHWGPTLQPVRASNEGASPMNKTLQGWRAWALETNWVGSSSSPTVYKGPCASQPTPLCLGFSSIKWR